MIEMDSCYQNDNMSDLDVRNVEGHLILPSIFDIAT